MHDEELIHSIDTAIERVNSAVWEKNNELKDREVSSKAIKQAKEEWELNLWAGKGLALKSGRLPLLQNHRINTI